jgi:hypothetical protein
VILLFYLWRQPISAVDNVLHNGAKQILDHSGKLLDSDKRHAADPTVFVPAYERELIAGFNASFFAQLFREHHLASLIDTDYRLDTAAAFAFGFGIATSDGYFFSWHLKSPRFIRILLNQYTQNNQKSFKFLKNYYNPPEAPLKLLGCKQLI